MYIEPMNPDEMCEQIKAFLLEGAKQLKAFCDANNVTIAGYTAPEEKRIRQEFETELTTGHDLLGLCLDNSIDPSDPLLQESLYQGYKHGYIVQDFNAFMAHAVKEITEYRKRHKKGRKHFEFERAPGR